MTDGRKSEDSRKVFISYKREEKALAEDVRAKLSELGVDYFMDDELKPDGHYSVKLDHQLMTAAAVLVLWTPMSAKSDFVYAEAEKGRRRGVLVAARFDIASEALPVPFSTFQTSDLSRWQKRMRADDPEWQIVLSTLGDKLGRPGLAALALALDSPDEALKHAYVERHPGDPMVAKLQEEITARREFEQNYKQLEGRVADWKRNIERRLKSVRRDFETRIGKLRRGSDPLVQPHLDAALDHNVEALHDRVQRYQVAAEEAQARVAQVESVASAAADRAAALEKTMAEHQAQLRAARAEAETLGARADALHAASEVTQSRLEEAEIAATAAAERAATLDKALGGLDAQFKIAREGADAARTAHDALKIQFESARSEAEVLAQRCRDLEEQRDEATAKAESLARQLGESREAIAHKDDKIDVLERAKSALQTSLTFVSRRYNYARIAAALALLVGLGAGGLHLFAPVVAGDEIGRLSAEVDDARKQLIAVQNADKARQQRLIGAQGQLTTVQASLKQEQERANSLNTRLLSKESEAAQANSQAKQSADQLKAEQDRTRALTSQIQTKDAELGRKDAEIGRRDSELTGLNQKVREQDKQLTLRQQEITNLQDQIKKQPTAVVSTKSAGTFTLASTKFTIYTNYDMMGGDLGSGERDISRDACESKCEANSLCVAYTYDKWKKNCTLKGSMQLVSLEPKGDTGVRADKPVPFKTTELERFCGYSGRAFRDVPSKSHTGTSREVCRQHCRSDQACIAFTHVSSQNTCRLFNTTTEPVAESGSNSEVKAQKPASNWCQ